MNTRSVKQAQLAKAFNDLDDVQQFFNGNVKALVDKSDSVDKRLFDEGKVKFREALKTLSLYFIGEPYISPYDTSVELMRASATAKVEHSTSRVLAISAFGYTMGAFNAVLNERMECARSALVRPTQSDTYKKEVLEALNEATFAGMNIQLFGLRQSFSEIKACCIADAELCGKVLDDDMVSFFEVSEDNLNKMADALSSLAEMNSVLNAT